MAHLQFIYLLNIMIFHSFLYVYQSVIISFHNPTNNDLSTTDVHRIRWWEKLQESPIFDGKNNGFL